MPRKKKSTKSIYDSLVGRNKQLGKMSAGKGFGSNVGKKKKKTGGAAAAGAVAGAKVGMRGRRKK